MQKRNLTKDEAATLILLAAIIFGAVFRIMPAWLAGFPLNDGGMFYTMILDLQANHYVPPLFTTYNNANVPFVYPPLGFYTGAALSDLFNISPLGVIRWLPGIISGLCIPAFYLYAKEVLNDKLQSAVAALAFALIPHVMAWYSMGGGLTRSLGTLFMLLTLTHVQRVFAQENKASITTAIVFGSLTALSHTEAPIYTAAIAIYIWAMKSRSLKGALHGAVIALGVVFVSSPWYGMVIYRHGMAPLISASQTGSHSALSVLKIMNINVLTEEPYLGLFGAISVLGIATLIAKKDRFLFGMLLVIFLAQPRSAHLIGNVPLTMAAGYFAVEILLPGVSKLTGNKKNGVFLVVIAAYILSNSIYYGLTFSGKRVSIPERTAMDWIAKNTPADGKFLVITGEQNAFCDATNEWFPSLAERESLTTAQGSEWLLGSDFGKNIGKIHKLQSCIDEGMECFTRETDAFGEAFDYVYVSIASATNNCNLANSSRKTRGLIIALENVKGYSVAYRSDAVVIFSK